ncbi:vascular endothelial growth factor C isoform X2 [Brienomyrus brachyistius]|uniref:vascular endothelial growth factor C isoform X2 n=1 Tax=Brienomyrus brachyistius TaxID=42636 RepID=UPI0020B430F2|nr:vascular endothelial growth factor C isoform X2 [Brienomyrus brachyistius]
MHLFGLSLYFVCIVFIYRSLAIESFQDYYDDYQGQRDFQEEVQPELEQRLRAASSVDELMQLVYRGSWTSLRCQYKLGQRLLDRGRAPTGGSGSEEPAMYAAAFYDFEVFKSIESEWRKTLCMPREVCLDVGKELGSPTNTFYKPPCVSVYRCGGCCNSEELQCMNVSTSYISKTLFEITVPISHGTKPVTIGFANHTLCRCLSKLDIYRQAHSIIRRALPECSVANKTCPRNQGWDDVLCRCVLRPDDTFSSGPELLSDDPCGPDRELDVETCECVCSRQAQAACGPGRVPDPHTCQCVCKVPAAPCRPGHVFSRDACQCICAKTCPRHQPLNAAKCACECTESPNRCFLRGRRFRPATCSCYRPPCEVRRRKCDAGYDFSEEVCRCIPTYWRRQD